MIPPTATPTTMTQTITAPNTSVPATTGTPSTLPGCDPQRLSSDLFHALSQPLTGLCCSLELALQQTLTAEQYRESVSRALMQAERASWLAMGIRELFEAGQAGEGCEVLALQAAVAGAIDDVLPVAEAAGVRIVWVPRSACPVWFEAQRLHKALFYLLGSMVSCGVPESVVRIGLVECGEQSLLGLTVSSAGPTQQPTSSSNSGDTDQHHELAWRLGVGIARAIFEAAGGSFRAVRSLEDISVEVRLARVGRGNPTCK